MALRPLALLALLLGACGATTEVRIATVEGATEDSIAMLLVPAQDEHPIGSSDQSLHLRAVKIDAVSVLPSEHRRFELPARKHEDLGEFEDCVHWPGSWFQSSTPQHVNSAHRPDFIG